MGYFRQIRTTQERRASQGEYYGRPRRNMANLPNSWDDIHRNKPQRTWKSFRKTQYKVNPVDYDQLE